MPGRGWKPFLSATFARREPVCSSGVCVSLSLLKDLCPSLGPRRNVIALSRLPPSLVVDVGAHDGTTSRQYAQAGHAVIAFEPSPSKLEKLRKLQHKMPNVSFEGVALGAASGETSFFVSGGGSEQDMLSRPPWAESAVAMGRAAPREVRVPVRRLDDFLPHPRRALVIKIDAQGHVRATRPPRTLGSRLGAL